LSSCDNNIISGNTVNNNTDNGIYLSSCDNNTITGNTVNNNTEHGIFLESSCNYNNITGNTACNNTQSGISLDNSDYNSLSGNIVYNNTLHGISLQTSSDDNNITENTVYNNIQHGIYLDDSFDLFVWDNYIHQNGIAGIYATGCTDNVFYGNVIRDNIDTGVILVSSDYMNFHENFFLGNTKHAFDDDPTNSWNSTTIGNYWDNWTSPDVSPNDGIVDVPYPFIGGSAGSIDYLPIAEDGAPVIVINSPASNDVFGVTAPSFDVIITDTTLVSMWYTIDGGINNYTFIENGIINQTAWAAKTEGSVTITFYASDIIRNIGIDEVSVVKDTTAPIIVINSPTDGDEFGTQAPLFNITVTENNLDAIWYSFDGGLTTYAITNNTVFNQTAWAALSEGDVTITFYARDLAGNEASEAVTIVKTAAGLDPGIIIIIVVVSIAGGVAAAAVIYIYLKKRASPK